MRRVLSGLIGRLDAQRKESELEDTSTEFSKTEMIVKMAIGVGESI